MVHDDQEQRYQNSRALYRATTVAAEPLVHVAYLLVPAQYRNDSVGLRLAWAVFQGADGRRYLRGVVNPFRGSGPVCLSRPIVATMVRLPARFAPRSQDGTCLMLL